MQSKLWVNYTVGQVTKFFFDPNSLAKWDRSVAQMIPTSNTEDGKGSTFDTVSPSGMRMSYEVINMTADSVKTRLVNSKMVKSAIWQFQFVPVGKGTEIICSVDVTFRLLFAFLYPVLYFTQSALLRDLHFLRNALDEHYQQYEKVT